MSRKTFTYTAEFRDEYEVQRLDLLRQRFLWYCGVVIGLGLVGLAMNAAGIWFARTMAKSAEPLLKPELVVTWVLSLFSTLLYVLAFSWVYRNPQKKEQINRIAFYLIVVSGVLSILMGPIVAAVARGDAQGNVRAGALTVSADEGAEPDETGLAALGPVLPDAAGLPGEGSAAAGERAGADDTLVGPPNVAGTAKKSRALSSGGKAGVVTFTGLWSVFLSHFFACLFLPWTPRESVRPIVPLLVFNAAVLLFYIAAAPVWIALSIALSPLVAGPGAAVCWWRSSRFRDSFTLNVLKGRYSEIKRELVDARRIHESLFPKPIGEGLVRLDYRYEPMRQIGGDYLYARQITPVGASHPVTHVIIVDVTGHGITAALTVNRLHGEIDRQLGEKPGSTPAEILSGLNNYLHHTLANHSVYATALCLRVDPARDELTWASAGHPPAFLRGSDGTVEELDSTTLVLGACRGDDFEAGQRVARFHRGDSLVAYTDGAIEARNALGRMLGVKGFRGMVLSLGLPAGEPCLDPLIRAVDGHRFGPIQDDTLLVELIRPLG